MHKKTGKAAQKLFIAQPPLSRQIRQLEKELGAELFERSPHGLRLTPAGNTFLPYAQQVMSLIGRSKENMPRKMADDKMPLSFFHQRRLHT